MRLFPLPGVDASHVYVRALAVGCFYSHISTGTFRRALTASVDSCAETDKECLDARELDAEAEHLADIKHRRDKPVAAANHFNKMTTPSTTHDSRKRTGFCLQTV